MNTISKTLALCLSLACLSGDRANAMSTTTMVDLSLKCVAVAALLWGASTLNALLAVQSDIRDMEFEKLMNNLCVNGCIPSDMVNISYAEEFEEHVNQTERDTYVYHATSITMPKDNDAAESDEFDEDEFDDMDDTDDADDVVIIVTVDQSDTLA